MRTLLTATVSLFVLALAPITAPAARAQSGETAATGLEVAVAYNYVHSNAPPGGCGCFSFNGGGPSVAWHFNSSFAVVGDFAALHANSYDGSSINPTLVSYLFGPRYTLHFAQGRLLPFAQVLLGGSHASNGFFPNSAGGASSANAFAMTAGGGLDIAIVRHVAIRAGQLEYFYTRFPNGVNEHQNNLRVSAGLVLRF
jgi:outer membrane immunogenic protein